MDHSKYFSPSSIARRLQCRLSAFLEAGMPESTNEYAEEGTFLHEAMEKWNIGKSMPTNLSSEQTELIDMSIRETSKLIEMSCGGVVHVEKSVNLSHLGYGDAFGTCDLVIDSPFKTLIIADYKFGQVRVESDNPQCRMYALMAAGESLSSYKEIILAVIQPKTGGLSYSTLKPEGLAEWFSDELEPCIKDINNGVMTANPSESACRYCKATQVCAAYTAHSLDIVQQDFTGELTATSPAMITDQMVNEYYSKIPLLEQWIKDIKNHAYEMAQLGVLDGYKLVEGRPRRTWADEEAAASIIIKSGNDPFEKKMLSPAKAEKLGKTIKEEVQKHIHRIPGKPVVAPIGDRRKAISTAAEDFKDFAISENKTYEVTV